MRILGIAAAVVISLAGSGRDERNGGEVGDVALGVPGEAAVPGDRGVGPDVEVREW